MDAWTKATAVASCIAAVGIIILATQLFLQRRIWVTDHDRSRKEKAIEVIKDYTLSANKSWAAVLKLVEKLSEEQCRKLYRGDKFKIGTEYKDLLFASIPNDIDVPSTGGDQTTIDLSERQVFALRWQAISFLNAVEVVLEAWARNVADQEIIENEMRFLYDPTEGTYALEKFRVCCGGKEGYPAIHDFIATMKEKKSAAKGPDRPIAS
jgi:hypothetical protein